MQKLQQLIEGIKSWAELENRIAALPSEMERGEAFEEFCKPFFLLDAVFQFKEVYRQKEIPYSIKQRLGYQVNQDIGIDGLCVTLDDKIYAYQAKFRSNRSNTPTLRELSTFFTVSDRADWRITISNADRLPTSINYHRPRRWFSWGTTTPDNVIRCCPSIISTALLLLLPLAVS